MQNVFLLSSKPRLPLAGDAERAAAGMADWTNKVNTLEDPPTQAFIEEFAAHPRGHALLSGMFGNSPFLTQALLKDVAFAAALFKGGPEDAFSTVLRDMATDLAENAARADLMRVLRIGRRRTALLVAAADLANLWSLGQVTAALSAFAEAALGHAVAHLLREAAGNGAFALTDQADPARGSGLIVLGMGKLGSRELNYSSDIDLIVLYDGERITTDDPAALQTAFVRLARNLVQVLQERTADGYVFRTDLRLRPDPGATPLAISTIAAETYYESMGQNWERAAMIKARPVAGDMVAGKAFLKRLRPFLWRRHLDFAAIRDIHSIKRQINAHRGGGTIALAGHNVKLGRGGIREIEFYAQTQQLIWGGREPNLRRAATGEALDALVDAGLVADGTRDDLMAAYAFLRRVEHRLQMVNDEQTQKLPDTENGVAGLAAFLGYDTPAAFADDLLGHLRRVEQHYAKLFEEAPELGGPGNLVFTGADHDPDTLATLDALGFGNAEAVSTIVRAWHHGRYRATRSQRARELLTEIMPALLTALSKTPNPDTAFVKFDEFLAGLPAGVQLFSLFQANPGLLGLVAEIAGTAPRLAEHLGRNALVLDAVLSPDFFDPPPAADALLAGLERALSQAADFQDVLDISRRWNNDHKFQVGVQMLRGLLAPDASGQALADIADAVLAALLPAVSDEFAAAHGAIAGGGMAIVAMGNLGGRELTMSSDLDLVFVYDAGPDGAESDGERPLMASHYFARLAQRYLNAVTALTGEGRLYEVDMRLRPSGNAGPIASSLDGFATYYENDAWTWELMALTRARVVCGPPALVTRIGEAVRAILVRPPAESLLSDVADMRRRIEAEHGTESIWNAKHVRGGLVDIEFIAQYLQLEHAAAKPDILSAGTKDALDRLAAADVLDRDTAMLLSEATGRWRAVQNMLRLTLDGQPDKDAVPDGLKAALARAGGVDDFTVLEAALRETAARVGTVYKALVGRPAEVAAAAPGVKD